RLHSGLVQRADQLIRARMRDDEQMPGRVSASGGDRERHVTIEPLRCVRAGTGPSPVAPGVQLSEQDPQDGGLQLVETGVVADILEYLLVPRAVEAKRSRQLGHTVVVGGDRPTVTKATEVLGRIERERGGLGERTGAAAVLARAGGLSRVLDHRQTQAAQLRERSGTAEQ